MFDTSIYNRGERGFDSGFKQGSGLRSGIQGMNEPTDEASALEAIKGGVDANMIIASLQKVNPSAAKSIMEILGMGGSGGSPAGMANMAMQAAKIFSGGF